jgi:tripeptide aminopeptidase
MNIGMISGGVEVNALAPEAQATIEFRDLSNTKLEKAVRALDRHVARAQNDGVGVASTTLGRRPGGRIAQRHPLVRDALRARRTAGLGTPRLTAASTDANAALGLGLPALTIGVATNHEPHSVDEHADVTLLGCGMRAAGALVGLRTADTASP